MKKSLLTLCFLPLTSWSLTLTSPDFKEGDTLTNKHVYKGFGCTGENISPALEWSGVPEEAKALALTVYDPDAPTGSGWWHWIVWNINPSTTRLPEGVILALDATTKEGRTDYNTTGYGGPCPPEGDAPHRYIFTIHALKEKLPLDNVEIPGAMAGYYINANTLEKASLTLKYGR